MEKKNFKIIYMSIVIISLTLIMFLYFNNKKTEFKNINIIIDEVLKSEESTMLYIVDSNKNDFNSHLHQLKYLVEEHGLKYYYIDVSNLPNYKSKKIYEKLGVDNSDSIVAIYEDGLLLDYIEGVTGLNRLHRFLKEYNIVNDNKLLLNYLNITSYIEKTEEPKFILALGDYTNEYSNLFEESLFEIVKEYKIDINFIYTCDLNTLEGELFESKIKNFKDFEVKIPSILIIEDSKIVDGIRGIEDKDVIVELLKENGIIK